MRDFIDDLVFGVRVLRRKIGLTIVAVIALGAGIGANSAIFSVIDGVLLRPLRFVAPDRLAVIRSVSRQNTEGTGMASYPDFRDWREQNRSFDQIAAFESRGVTITGSGEPERVEGASVSATLFPLLGVEPVIGRTFTEEEDTPKSTVVVLSYGLWQRRFGGSPEIVGQAITIEGVPRTVLGVLPRDFQVPLGIEKAEVFFPVTFDGMLMERRRSRYLTVIGRLKPDVSLSQAQSDLEMIAARLEKEYPDSNTNRTVALASLYERLVGSMRPALLILWGAVGLVLLVACTNVAHLMMASTASRQKEIAIRIAVGASRWRVMRQLLTESMLLGLLGGAVGLLLALQGISLLASLASDTIPRLNEVSLDARAVGFTLIVSLLVGMISGIIPALLSTKPRLYESLKEGGRTSAETMGRSRFSSILIVSEVTFALILIVGAGLLVRSFIKLNEVDKGFDARNVLTGNIILPYAKFRQASTFIEQAVDRIEELPGVEAAGSVTQIPLNKENLSTTFTIEGRPAPEQGNEPRTEIRAITGSYFRAMGIPLIKGREFTRQDREDSPAVAIINEALARAHWPDEDPIGKRIKLSLRLYNEPQVREIVGVVGDVRHKSLTEPPVPELYVPHMQQNWPFTNLIVRTRTDPISMIGSVRNQVFSVDPLQPISSVRTMEQIVADSVARQRFYMVLIGISAALALILALVGIYGILSYTVTQRRNEIGIRMALGAKKGDIIRLFVGRGMKLALVGTVIGIGGSLAVTRVMSSLLFGISSTDITTFVSVPLAIIGVTLIACYIPARRAAETDPQVALRYE